MTKEEAKCVIENMLVDAEKYGDIDYCDLSDFISACKVAIESLSDIPVNYYYIRRNKNEAD